MSAVYEWGYVEEDRCRNCLSHTELYVHSAAIPESEVPKCVPCHIYSIKYHGDTSDCDTFGLNALITVTPSNSPNIYGEPKPTCFGCGSIIQDEAESTEAIYYNDKHSAHLNCTESCARCDDLHIVTNYSYSFRRIHNRSAYHALYETTSRDFICNGCIDNEGLSQCNCCDRYIEQGDESLFQNESYCNSCYDDHVCTCCDCDEDYWDGDGHDCDNGIIHNWDYKPSPNFFSCSYESPSYYLGLELEVENTTGNYGTRDKAHETQGLLGDRAYLKHDGSISDGFEIVTHPHTLEAMRNDFNWEALQDLRESGFRSWNASSSSCGIHVHISRTAFGQNDRRRVTDHKRDAHILRFMKLIYDNQRQVERLAGRAGSRWATFSDKGSLVYKVKQGNQNDGRYSAVNTDNYNTLEVRVFKGSLKKERVLSALEFVTAAAEYTRNLSVNGTNHALEWSRFVAYVVSNADIYPNLLSKIGDSFATDQVTN